jgi:uridine kinase
MAENNSINNASDIDSNIDSNIPAAPGSEFGKLIKEALEKKNLKGSRQLWLAENAGVSQGYISALIRGEKDKPSEAIVRRIASALQTDADQLLKSAGIETKVVGRPTVVGIAGPSGGGKSWFADMIKSCQPSKVLVINLDSFYIGNPEKVKDLDYTYDNPKSIDEEKALASLKKLKEKNEADIPVYCFKTGKTIGNMRVSPLPIIVIEGHLLFHYKAILEHLDIKVWIEADLDIALGRRIIRDRQRLGGEQREKSDAYDSEKVISEWRKNVVPAYDEFIRKTRSKADIVVINNFDSKDVPFAAKAIVSYASQRPSDLSGI